MGVSTCAHCGEEFKHRGNAARKFCGFECMGASRQSRVEFRCMNCGDTFAVVKGRTAGEQAPRYCSAECKYAHFQLHKRNRIAKVCPVCGKAFETYPSHDNTYCSYTCMGVAKERKEERVCATCGDTFTVKKSLVDICCSWECRVERLRGENHASWRGGKLPNYAGDWQRQKRRARERDGNVCQRCGKTAQENGENMSVHHIRPYRSFDDPVEANRLDNLESLCRNCHMKIKD